MKKLVTTTFSMFILLGIPWVLGFFLAFSLPPPPGELAYEIIQIPSGATLHRVSSLLKERSIVESPRLFMLLARWRGVDTQIKPGKYYLSRRMLPNEVLNKLISGDQVRYTITIPEGLTVAQIASLFDGMGLARKEKFIQLATDSAFIASLGMDDQSLEGYLFPDTYRFYWGIGEERVIRRLVQRFNRIYNREFKNRADEINLTRREVVTIASIVERETGVRDERPLVSAVLHNRLNKNMRLQCDPCVIYGLENFNGDLTRKELETYTPYNTYLVAGLPPTPIANPGKDSLHAALYPANSDSLYFVAKNDGTHYFSRSLPEHNHAVHTFQKPRGKEGTP
jgi:UPF0755 protein